MKKLFIILSILGLTLADTAPELDIPDELPELPSTYIFESVVEGILKNLSATLAKNDPMTIPDLAFNVSTSNVSIDFDAKDVQITGYSNFAPTSMKITVLPPAITFNVLFGGIDIYTPNYSVNALLLFIPFYGQGSGDINVTAINLGGSASVSIGLSGITGISNLKLNISLADATFNITGLLNNEPFSAIVSAAATDFFSDFINKYHERFEALLAPTVQKLINNILNPPKFFDDVEVPAEPVQYKDEIELDDETVFKYRVTV